MGLSWDGVGQKKYETGLKMGVLYPVNESTGVYAPGVAWNGLTAVNESPEGAEASDLYADDAKYISLYSAENFKGTIEAYTYPDEFAALNGEEELLGTDVQAGVYAGQQKRGAFGLCYRTVMGNDVSGDNYGYKLHLVYGCKVSPSEKAYKTINDSPEAISFSWEFSTTPVAFKTTKQTSQITIDSTKFTTTTQKAKLTALEDILYGNDTTETNGARLPLPDEIITKLTPSP